MLLVVPFKRNLNSIVMNLQDTLAFLFGGNSCLGRKAFIAAVAVLALNGVASAASLGVNYVNSGDGGVQNGAADALGAADFAGVPGYEQLNWNNLGRWGNPTSLNDSFGAMTGVNVTWDSANTWNTGVGTSTANDRLMAGYLDATGQPNLPGSPYSGWNNANKPDAYVTGLGGWLSSLGASSYSVIIYTDGDATEGRISEYWLQNASGSDFGALTLGGDLTSRVFARDSANFSGVFTQVPGSANSVSNAVDGNYVLFTGLTADTFLMRTEEQLFRAQINGFQIIAEVPEPGAMALLGLGGLSFLLARRRRQAS